jgi:hypothetical protein
MLPLLTLIAAGAVGGPLSGSLLVIEIVKLFLGKMCMMLLLLASVVAETVGELNSLVAKCSYFWYCQQQTLSGS